MYSIREKLAGGYGCGGNNAPTVCPECGKLCQSRIIQPREKQQKVDQLQNSKVVTDCAEVETKTSGVAFDIKWVIHIYSSVLRLHCRHQLNAYLWQK